MESEARFLNRTHTSSISLFILSVAHAMSSATPTFASSSYATDKSAPTSIVAQTSRVDLKLFKRDEGWLVHDVVKHVLSIKRGWSNREPKTSIHYDVFINHRGTDVKNTLASHLYYRLRDDGLRVFFDKEEAQKGYTINSVVENAIRVASPFFLDTMPNQNGVWMSLYLWWSPSQ